MSEEPKRSTWDIPSEPSHVRAPRWWLDLQREDLPAERPETGQPVLATTTAPLRRARRDGWRLSTVLITALVVGFITVCVIAELGAQGAAGSALDALAVVAAAAVIATLIVRAMLRQAS